MASSSNSSSAVLKGVAVVLVLVVLFFGYRALFSNEQIWDEFPTVCVETGKIYWLSRDDLVRVPAQNPKTGQRTLLPCVEQDGKFYLDPRYREALELDSLKEVNQYVDSETLEVRPSP